MFAPIVLINAIIDRAAHPSRSQNSHQSWERYSARSIVQRRERNERMKIMRQITAAPRPPSSFQSRPPSQVHSRAMGPWSGLVHGWGVACYINRLIYMVITTLIGRKFPGGLNLAALASLTVQAGMSGIHSIELRIRGQSKNSPRLFSLLAGLHTRGTSCAIAFTPCLCLGPGLSTQGKASF